VALIFFCFFWGGVGVKLSHKFVPVVTTKCLFELIVLISLPLNFNLLFRVNFLYYGVVFNFPITRYAERDVVPREAKEIGDVCTQAKKGPLASFSLLSSFL